MVAISHVLWTTGLILPLPEIAAAAHDAGATLLIDGAQSGGAIPLDMHATGADFYAASGQKWLLGPQGTGALWVHPRHHETLRPATPSYFTYADGHVGPLRPGAARFDPGSIDTIDVTNPSGGNCESDASPGNMRCMRIRVGAGGQVRMCDPSPNVTATDSRYCQ